MKLNSLQLLAGNTDIYLLDQMMKGRYNPTDRILDAGCGSGRNLHWFIEEDMEIYGTDRDPHVIESLKLANPTVPRDRFQTCSVEQMPFPDNFFDHVISSAVLHFATDTLSFWKMVGEMVRVLKPAGSLFIRMTTDVGIEDKVENIKDGVYLLPDGSTRFLLTKKLLGIMVRDNSLSFIEPFKTVNVDDCRCMCTLVLQKDL